MGYLIELDPPASFLAAACRPPAAALRRRPPPRLEDLTPLDAFETTRIEDETPLLPRVVAEAVWEEASVWLGEQLPRDWINQLSAMAQAVYARNPRFRSLLRRRGNAGRDWLWSFTRHWLCGLVYQHRPELHRLLPASYNVGRALPQ